MDACDSFNSDKIYMDFQGGLGFSCSKHTRAHLFHCTRARRSLHKDIANPKIPTKTKQTLKYPQPPTTTALRWTTNMETAGGIMATGSRELDHDSARA